MKLDSVAKIIEAARLAVNNTTKDPEVAKRMSQYGFPLERMQEGRELLEKVQELHLDQDNHYGERWQISNQINQTLETLRPLFLDHVTIARFAFRHDPGILHKLDIGNISSAKWTWVKQAHAFYLKVIAYADQIAPHGASQADLLQAKALLENVLELREDRILKKGEAEDSTESRNHASKVLKKWVSEFRASARLALKDHPQKLEAFGIKVPTLRT